LPDTIRYLIELTGLMRLLEIAIIITTFVHAEKDAT